MNAKLIINNYENGGSFHQALYKAVTKADFDNLGHIRKGFPELVDAFCLMTQGKPYNELCEINKKFYVRVRVLNNGKLIMKYYGETKPKSEPNVARYDQYIDEFETAEEARKFIEDGKNA